MVHTVTEITYTDLEVEREQVVPLMYGRHINSNNNNYLLVVVLLTYYFYYKLVLAKAEFRVVVLAVYCKYTVWIVEHDNNQSAEE